MAPRKTQQSNLDAFFGSGCSTKKLKVLEQKENSLGNDDDDNADDDDVNPSALKRSVKSASAVVQAKKRKVIDDDSSDEDPVDGQKVPNKVTSTPLKTEPEKEGADMKQVKNTNNKSTLSKSRSKSSLSQKNSGVSMKDVENVSDKLQCRPVSLILSKSQFPSDEAVLGKMDESWRVAEMDHSMPYSVLCEVFSKIESITGRLQIQEILTTLFRQILLRPDPKNDLQPVLYLASNSVAPAYECVELGIGDAILIRAIGEATGTNPNIVKERYEKQGDLGTVAQGFKSKQKTLGGFFAANKSDAPGKAKNVLTVMEVLKVFREIAETKGNQAQKWKVDKIKRLLVRSTVASETKYIVRGLQGKLRIGLAQSTVLISLAHALALTIPVTIVPTKQVEEEEFSDEAKQYLDKSLTVEKRLEGAVAIVKKAYSEVPSYDAILNAALSVPLERINEVCTLKPGIPVAPMLAKPTKSIQEVLKRLNGLKFTCEYKYDGERAQVHLMEDGTTKVFSRNLLDTSEKFPEVPLFVRESCKDVTSFVLDTEVVAFNNKTGQLVPFQILSTRKKTEESAETAKVQVIVQAFDIMYLNGESLLNRSLAERRALLFQHFIPVPGKFQFAKSMDHEENGDTTVIEDFLDNAVKGQCEGLMIKTLEVNANYEPSRRSLNWLKLKKDYLDGLGDSVDLVPLGAYHGRGKRTGVYGAYLLACFDPDTEEFQSVCKIGTGFSEEDLKILTESLNEHKIPQKSSQYNVSDQLECDVWFDAVQVWEVKAADLSKSSAHRGAVGKTGDPGRGIGFRFPRFERRREDKKPEDATTSDQILDMYYNQDALAAGEETGMDDDDGI